MNTKDLKLIKQLRKNAREKLTKISRETGIPVSTLHERMQQTEFIKQYTVLLDFAAMGFSTKVHILYKVSRRNREELRKFLIRNESVNSLFKINNGYDFLSECLFKNLRTLEDFLENVRDSFDVKTEVHYIIEDLVQEGFYVC